MPRVQTNQSGRRPLLIVEDDPALQKQMRWAFDQTETVVAEDAETALAQVRRHEPAVVTMDLGLPPRPDDPDEGLALLQRILEIAPLTKIIVLTGQNDRKNALRAIGAGAFDFHAKPFEPELLQLTIDRAFRVFELQLENHRLQELALLPPEFSGMVTQDPQLLRVCRLVEKVATSNVSVLIRGESGTGKELLARACHSRSPRKDGNFVAINCAAIPETLLESELFGFEKGAFTGAIKQKLGKIELASGGTLFLDEIGDMPLALQVKLLRFLQERVIERIGGHSQIDVDVRIVCATHQNLRAMIEEGSFREDLYYRLAEIDIEIPPLRQRPGDATLLARAFLRRFSKDLGHRMLSFSTDAVLAVEAAQWPGNVRELESAVRRAAIMCEGGIVSPADLGLAPATGGEPLNLRQVRERAERAAVTRAIGLTDGNLSRAAELLGISRPTLYEMLEKLGLPRN